MTLQFSHPAISRVQRPLFAGIILIITSLLLGAGLCGCERLAPRNQFYKKSPPLAFKRAPLHGERDFVHRWRAKAYTPLKTDPASGSTDQQTILSKYGQPDYTRCFVAQKCEKTVEWLYLDKDMLVQFVQGDLAYTGPVTDYEKLLVDRGYPNSITRTSQARGPERVDAAYWTWDHRRTQIYAFADGYLVGMQE